MKMFIFITLLLSSCTNNDPNYIEELKDNFSCLIQGEALFPKKKTSLFLSAYLSEDKTRFSLEVMNNSERYKKIRIDVNTANTPLKEKEYLLKKINFDDLLNSTRAECYFEKNGGSEIELVEESSFHTTNETMGTVTIIKIDTINNNIIGSFEFEAFNKFNEIINITNGQFNTTYIN